MLESICSILVCLSRLQDESETESEESSEESSNSEESTEEEEEEEEKVKPTSKKVHTKTITVPYLVCALHNSFCVSIETNCPLLTEEDRVKGHQAQGGDLSTDPGQL